MSAIGPELPPHLLNKRKRQAEEDAAAPSRPSPGPPQRSSSPENGEKRRKVIGPALPPAPLDEMPPRDQASDDDSSSDDDFGPALPSAGASHSAYDTTTEAPEDDAGTAQSEEPVTKRDEWMMMPPTQDGLAARMDPTKLRARKFNTGKGARAPQAPGDNAIWTETPEQKRKRLENEVLGVTAPAGSSQRAARNQSSKEDQETARRIQKQMEKARGKSLMDMHQARTDKEEEDDPSKRAFDRDKDMGGSMKVGRTQRNEMLKHAKDMGSRFSGGGYL